MIGAKLSAFTYSLLTRSFQAFLPASKPCAVTHGVHHPSYLMKNATLFGTIALKKGNGLVTSFPCKSSLALENKNQRYRLGTKDWENASHGY